MYHIIEQPCSCQCHKSDQETEKLMKSNFLQVGRTIECGRCHPEKFEDCVSIKAKYGVKCKCICHDIYSTCGPYSVGEIDKPCCASCPECRCHKENSEIPNNLSNVNCCEYCISLSIPKTCMIKKCGCHLPMGISNWINHGKQYHYFDYIDDKMLIELRQESRNYAKNGKSMQINPLKQRVYKRLVKMKLKDAASKINELVEEINKLKNENNNSIVV